MEVRRVVVRSRLASITTAHNCRVMRSFRRILAALLVLVFGLGMAAHGVQAGEMAQMTVAVAADQPMPDDCDGCGGSDMAQVSVCMLACSGGSTVVPQAQPMALGASIHAYESLPEPRILGSSGAPDPHPPKSPVPA